MRIKLGLILTLGLSQLYEALVNALSKVVEVLRGYSGFLQHAGNIQGGFELSLHHSCGDELHISPSDRWLPHEPLESLQLDQIGLRN